MTVFRMLELSTKAMNKIAVGRKLELGWSKTE